MAKDYDTDKNTKRPNKSDNTVDNLIYDHTEHFVQDTLSRLLIIIFSQY